MKTRRILAFLLALALTAMLPAAAAEYEQEQYFEAEEGIEEVYSVQLAASSLVSDSCALRDTLLKNGLDGFVLHMRNKCCVMSGKFASEDEARQYAEVVNYRMKQTNAAVVKVSVPESAAENFRENYEPFEEMFTDGCRHYGFMDDREFFLKNGGGPCYAVQVAQGPNRDGALLMVKELRDEGYYAYLYDRGENGICRVTCGAFTEKEDAEEYMESIREVARINDAYIVDVMIPMFAVNDFARLYYGK